MDFMRYQQIIARVKGFLEEHPQNFDTCYQALKQIQRECFTALEPADNPVVRHMSEWNIEQLAFVIVEYSGFSNEAIHMLVDAMIRNHDWQGLQQEILHNIEEERGLKTRSIPHLEIMRQGYRVDLGIETDDVQYSPVTSAFIDQMRHIFKHDDNAFSAGALLAFEGVAINEFKILDLFVRHYQDLQGRGLVQGSLTNLYIDGHKEFEIDHEDDLRQAIAPYIHAENIHRFIRGYLSVCLTMDTWWEKLALETCSHMLYRALAVGDVEFFDVSQVFSRHPD